MFQSQHPANMRHQGHYQDDGEKRGWLQKVSDAGYKYNATTYFKCFLSVRLVQFICLVTVLGLAANWVSEIGRAAATPNWLILATLIFPVLGLLAVIITIVMLFEGTTKGLLAIIAADVCVLGFFAALSGYWAGPLAYVDCAGLGNMNATAQATAAQTFAFDLSHSVSPAMTLKQGVDWWASSSKQTCMELSAAWGMCIALTILFLISTLLAGGLYHKKAKAYDNGGHGNEAGYHR